ncbi:MAG: hypothetical protein KAR20_28335, partial [Candidatus Heimdallarchaeota archaeon]|nr:hypothetical protein [Candidatus Heimdallarchaeota archaeon]
MSEITQNKMQVRAVLSWPMLFVGARLILLISLPLEAIRSYGDYWNFSHQAGLGIPFWDYWTEFPPVFPFLAYLVDWFSGGKSHVFDYLLFILFTIFQAGSLYIFVLIRQKTRPDKGNNNRDLIYFLISLVLFYSWSYFDPIAVFLLLLGVYWLASGKDIPAILSISAGVLTKWFPILVLPTLWKIREPKKALRLTLLGIGIVIIVWGGLFTLNPQMTKASLYSQASKGSWETVWALLDKNIRTGNFGREIDHLNPSTATLKTGNPPVVPSWITLIIFGGLGLILLLKVENPSETWVIHFTGLSLIILFLWSPGYSPQWIL